MEHGWSWASPLPGIAKESLGQPSCFKRKLLSTKQTGFMRLIYIMSIMFHINIYETNLVGFRLLFPSLSTWFCSLLFSLFQVKIFLLLRGVVTYFANRLLSGPFIL